MNVSATAYQKALNHNFKFSFTNTKVNLIGILKPFLDLLFLEMPVDIDYRAEYKPYPALIQLTSRQVSL